MNARLLQPLPVAALALALSLAASSTSLWLQAGKFAARVAEVRRAAAAKAEAADHARRAQGWDFWTIEMENLANELEEEKAQLQQRSTELDQRQARVDAEFQELDRVRDQIDAVRRQIDQSVIAIQANEYDNLHRLAQMYSTLDPADAVAIMKNMDDREAVKILSLMKPDVVGPIFDAMAKPQPDGTSLAPRAALLLEKLRLVKDAAPDTAASP